MEPEHYIVYYEDGTVQYEQWRLNGKLHRVDAPACIHYREDGTVSTEVWYLNGLPSRKDGPAYTYYCSDGVTPLREVWRWNGKLHRENGPTITEYNEDGTVKWEAWYLNAVALSWEEWLERTSVGESK